MAWIDPRAEAARRKYWTRHDAYRFAAPGTPEVKMPGWLDPSATRVRLKEAQEEEARAAFAAEMAELQASHERAREMLAEVKYELAWRRLCREFGYVPNQQLDRKWDGQPRDRGRFSFGKMPTLLSNPAFLAPAVRVAIGAQKALERALALFSAMSARNNPAFDRSVRDQHAGTRAWYHP